MLQPKRTKYRKQFKGRNRGLATRGSKVSFGEFGLKATARGRITARQIEAARRVMTRHIKRGGRVWIRIFPDQPISKKPAEVRMGNGKGSTEYYVAQIQPGKMLYEMDGVSEELAREAFRLAAAKLPIETTFMTRQLREVGKMKATDLRAKSVDELNAELIELRRAQFSLRMQIATQQLTKVDQLGKVRKDVARVKLVLAEKAKQA